MTDIERAKNLLQKNNFTCVLCKDSTVYTASQNGISPMVDFIAAKTDLNGFSAADRIVGKAAAMLFALAGVRAVHAEVMSEKAVAVFEQYGISYTYDTLTAMIANRDGTGPCPMEKAVTGISDPAEALAAIKRTLDRLRSKSAN